MEFNGSSFYDTEEPGKQQLNSTALDLDTEDSTKENEQKEWKLSPIVPEEKRGKSSIFRGNHGEKRESPDFKSPLKAVNSNESPSSESKNATDPKRSDPKLSISADLSSFMASNPFDSILLNSLHKSINFSPRVVFSQESCSSTQQKDGEKFQWSVEQLAILKPAHISEDEIAASYRSPIPELEEKIQEALNEYWTKNVTCIPSPDGPRYVHLPHRDGSVTTYKYGSEGPSSGLLAGSSDTPSLANIIRKKEAVKAAYATSSPKQRPRSFRHMRQMRNRTAQTELTIPPNLDLDLRKLLGEQFHYQADAEEADDDDEEVFNVSASSQFSTRRRLFSTGGLAQEEDEEAPNTSADEQLLDETGQPFNDSLSPVRRSEDVTDERLEEGDEMEQESSTQSAATRSHVSQIAINVSILNDCMMHSMDEEDAEEHDEHDSRRAAETNGNAVDAHFSQSHLHENEYEMLDRSSSANATPRHEDLDWTPRRIGSSSIGRPNGSARRGVGSDAHGAHLSAGIGGGGGAASSSSSSEFRRFMFDMSPIHPNHHHHLNHHHHHHQHHHDQLRTPIQRCHLNLPRGFSLDDDDNDDDDVDRDVLENDVENDV